MTGRMWMWSGGLGIVGVILLISDIHARATWTQSATDVNQVITLNQLVGFIFSGMLLIIATTILVTGYRHHRSQRRRLRRTTR